MAEHSGVRNNPAERGESPLEALLIQVARGDQAAFESVYDQMAGPVYGLIRKVLRDPAQSEEVAQEVLLEVWRTASRFDPSRGGAMAWVLTMAHRRAVDRVRAETAAAERERRSAVPVPLPPDDVADSVAASLEAERVRRCLDGLTELQRQSITLAYYQGYTYQQVASRLEVALGTVKARIRDGLHPAAGLPGGGVVRLLRRWRLHALAGAYALDALEIAERDRFERHLRGCRDCEAEVRGLTATATALGMAAAADPPRGLKQAVLAVVAALGSARAVDAAIAALLSAPDARTTSAATSAGGTATVVSSLRQAAFVFTSSGLRALPATEVYELWFIGRGGARPAGLVPPASGGGTSPVLASGLEPGDQVGVTIEPAGGTAAPTTTPIVVMTLAYRPGRRQPSQA